MFKYMSIPLDSKIRCVYSRSLGFFWGDWWALCGICFFLPRARQVVGFGCYDVSAVQAKQSCLSWRLEVLSDRLNDFSSPQTLEPISFHGDFENILEVFSLASWRLQWSVFFSSLVSGMQLMRSPCRECWAWGSLDAGDVGCWRGLWLWFTPLPWS